MTPDTSEPTATQPATVTISRFYPPHVVTVDGDAGPQDIPVRVRRLTHGALAEFVKAWGAAENPESAKRWHRRPDSDELAITKDDRGFEHFTVSEGEIRRRRLAEMSDEARAEIEALEQREAADAYALAVETVRSSVCVSPKWPSGAPFTLHIEDEAGAVRPASTGADLVEIFGGNFAAMTRLAGLVAAENMLSAEKKTRSRGRFVSSTGSAPVPPAPGSSPAATVADAAPPDSVPSGAAPGPTTAIG